MKKKLIQMHHLRTRHILPFLMMCAVPISALDMQLNSRVGSTSSYSMSNIQKINFNGGNLVITQ
jgi:hypothetical protein